MMASSKVERSQGRVGRPLLGMPSFLSTMTWCASRFGVNDAGDSDDVRTLRCWFRHTGEPFRRICSGSTEAASLSQPAIRPSSGDGPGCEDMRVFYRRRTGDSAVDGRQRRCRCRSVDSRIAGLSQDELFAEHTGRDQHPADSGTETFEIEAARSLSASFAWELIEVDAALARLEAGTYGRCERCGTLIDPERLDVVPATRLCVVDEAATEAR